MLHTEQGSSAPIIPRRPHSGAANMNLPKQSRPVIRDVSRDPIGARVRGADGLSDCVHGCRVLPAAKQNACINMCTQLWGNSPQQTAPRHR